MKDGLTLTGMLVASDIKTGNRKEDGKAYARRTAMISIGTTCISFSEPLDITQKNAPYPIGKRVTVDCEWARSENGNTSVGGSLEFEKNGTTKA